MRALVLAVLVTLASPLAAADEARWRSMHARPVPSPTPPAAQVALGAALFFDSRLSRHGTRSCADCHRREHGWTDGLSRARALDGRSLRRKTPTLWNLGDGLRFFWDGRARSLEELVLVPLANPDEMDTPPAEAVRYLQSDAAYVRAFRKAFGEAPSERTLAAALAAFVATREAPRSRFDAWLEGDDGALDASEKRGLALFHGKAQCIACHRGHRLTTDAFHFLGLRSDDPGVGGAKNDPLLEGFFKVPTLRDVASRPPYMHDGSLDSLESVVDFYDRGGDVRQNRAGMPSALRPLGLTKRERRDLIAFLRTLGGDARGAVVAPPSRRGASR